MTLTIYLLCDEDGDVTRHKSLPEYVSWDSWPSAIKIELNAGPGYSAFRLKKSGWEEIDTSESIEIIERLG